LIRSTSLSLTPAGHVVLSHSCPKRLQAFGVFDSFLQPPTRSLTPAGHVVLSHSCPKHLQAFGVFVCLVVKKHLRHLCGSASSSKRKLRVLCVLCV